MVESLSPKSTDSIGTQLMAWSVSTDLIGSSMPSWISQWLVNPSGALPSFNGRSSTVSCTRMVRGCESCGVKVYSTGSPSATSLYSPFNPLRVKVYSLPAVKVCLGAMVIRLRFTNKVASTSSSPCLSTTCLSSPYSTPESLIGWLKRKRKVLKSITGSVLVPSSAGNVRTISSVSAKAPYSAKLPRLSGATRVLKQNPSAGVLAPPRVSVSPSNSTQYFEFAISSWAVYKIKPRLPSTISGLPVRHCTTSPCWPVVLSSQGPS